MKVFLQRKNCENNKLLRDAGGYSAPEHQPSTSGRTGYGNISIRRESACACGGGCPRCNGVIQPKLMINQPGDKYEEEADRMADKVMRMPEPQAVSGGRHLTQRANPAYEEKVVQRQPAGDELRRQPEEKEEEEEEILQTKPIAEHITPSVQRQVEEEEEEGILQVKGSYNQTAEVTPDIESRIQSLKGGGQPLPISIRAFFESRFGYDFSGVRVHKDAKAADSARAVNARAYTVGKDVVFGVSQYAPETSGGRLLLAHELTHVVQASDVLRRESKPANIFERESKREIELSNKTSGLLYYGSVGAQEAKWKWLKGGGRAGTHLQAAHRFLLYNFAVGKADLDKTKNFGNLISKVVAQVISILETKHEGRLLYRGAVGIFGHTSKSGSEEINTALANERAANVYDEMQNKLPLTSLPYLHLVGDPADWLGAQTLSGFKIRHQMTKEMRSINRSVEIILFLGAARPRQEWRRDSLKKIKERFGDDKRGKLGMWILNNWEYFTTPSKSGYAWAPSASGGDYYGLFFKPPSPDELISSEIRELRPAKAAGYIERLYETLVDDLLQLGVFYRVSPDCGFYECQEPFKGTGRCGVRYCRYTKLQSEANAGSIMLKDIFVVEWGKGALCAWSQTPAPTICDPRWP